MNHHSSVIFLYRATIQLLISFSLCDMEEVRHDKLQTVCTIHFYFHQIYSALGTYLIQKSINALVISVLFLRLATCACNMTSLLFVNTLRCMTSQALIKFCLTDEKN
jgi:hypothetical protein